MVASRRLRLALAAALAIAALGLLTVAQSYSDDDEVKGDFSTPARQVGDRGLYTVAHLQDGIPLDPLPEGSEVERIFEVLEPAAAYNASGKPFAADRVREAWLFTGSAQGEFGEDWRVALDDGVIPASAESLEARRWWSGLHCEGVCATVSVYESALYRIDTDRSAVRFGDDGGLCGVRNAAQLGRVDLSDDVTFLGGCARGKFRAIDRTSLPDHAEVVIFEARDGDEVTQVWLASDIPYPLRVWNGGVNGTGTAYTLAVYDPGESAASPSPDLGDALPPRTLAPRGPLGPDTEGFDMPFPISQAIEIARADAAGEALDQYLTSNPDAQVAAAAFSEETNGHWRHRTWRIEFVGETDYAVSILLGQAEEGEPQAIAPFYSTDPDAAVNGELEVASYRPREDLAPVTALPDELPAVWSLAEVYEAMRPDAIQDVPANAWSYSVTCKDPACGETDVWVAVGHHRLNSDQASLVHNTAPGQQPDVYAYAYMVAADGTGDLAFVDRVDQIRSQYDHAQSPPPGSGAEWNIASRTTTGAWDSPGPWVAAGTGIALAAVAIVILADALRHGGAGLFSRIAASELADQPVRARLLAAVAAEPGIHVSALRRRLSIAAGTAQHHLDKLVQGGLLLVVPHGRHTRYFPAGAKPEGVARAKALGAEGSAQVLEAVRQRPGITVTELAATLGKSPGTVAHHLDKLQAAGLLERRRAGRSVGVYATSAGDAADDVAAAA